MHLLDGVLFLCVLLLTLGRSGGSSKTGLMAGSPKSIVLKGLSSLWWQGMDQSWPIYSQNICHWLWWAQGWRSVRLLTSKPPSTFTQCSWFSCWTTACRSHTLLWQMCGSENSWRSSFSSFCCVGSAEACLNNQFWSFWLAHRTRLDYFPRPVRTRRPLSRWLPKFCLIGLCLHVIPNIWPLDQLLHLQDADGSSVSPAAPPSVPACSGLVFPSLSWC